MTDLTQDERDLLKHLINGKKDHSDGTPIRYGAWMMEVLRTLKSKGLVEIEDVDLVNYYFPTYAGEQALKEATNGADR